MPDIVEKVYGYHIYFWSNEGEPLEPIHFHVSYRPHKDATKIWILSDGTLQIANNRDEIPLNVLNRILRFMGLAENINVAKVRWKEHFEEIRYFK